MRVGREHNMSRRLASILRNSINFRNGINSSVWPWAYFCRSSDVSRRHVALSLSLKPDCEHTSKKYAHFRATVAGMLLKLFKRFVAATVAQKWAYFLSLSLIHFQTRSATNRLSDFDEHKTKSAHSIYHSIPYHILCFKNTNGIIFHYFYQKWDAFEKFNFLAM